MKLKSLLFGSAAVLAAGTGAQAADLPVAEPVEYVRICDAFGTGFYYIPGTDTCLRISGRVRVEAHYVDVFDGDDDDDDDEDGGGGDDPNFFGVDREFNNYTTRARGNIRFDARTQTDIGLVRAFANFEMTVGPSDFSTNYDSTGAALAEAFVQISYDWGTFTAGHTASFFDFWGSNTFGTRIGIDDNTTEQTLFAFTFSGVGGGFSATLSLEDPASSGRRLNPGVGFEDGDLIFSDDNYEGQEWPDVVGNVRWDGGWGSAQLMGVLHPIHDKDGADAFLGPEDLSEGEDDDDQLGWAVGGGLNLGLPFAGLGFNSQAGYADGALGYITEDIAHAGDFTTSCDTIGDDIGCSNETNTAWMVRAGLTADFTSTVGGSIDASYTDIDVDGPGGDDDDDDDDDAEFGYQLWALAANVTWEPVSGLLFGVEGAYNNISFDGADDAEDEGDSEDSDIFGVMFRVQRDF